MPAPLTDLTAESALDAVARGDMIDVNFWNTLKEIGDVIVPWVLLPALYYAWRIQDEMRQMRNSQQEDRKQSLEKFHAMELRQARLEAEQEHSQRQRDHNHGEILRRLDEITVTLKGKADKK